MNATSPRQEYMNYRLTSEYWRQRRLDGIRIAEDARDTARREAAEESRKAAVKSWVALGLSVTAAAVSALSLFLR